MLISADEILEFYPIHLPKCQLVPLMAFLYRPHKSPPVPPSRHGPLLAPYPSPHVEACDYLMSSRRGTGGQ